MDTNKPLLIPLIIIISIFALTFIFIGFLIKGDINRNQVEKIEEYGTAQGDITKYSTATTSRLALTTSTDGTYLVTASIPESAVDLYFDLQLTASTTGDRAEFNWEYEYSNDRIDWYGVRTPTSTGELAQKGILEYAPATTSHRYTVDSSELLKMKLKVPIIDNFVRVKVTRASTSNFLLWGQLNPVTSPSNR